MGEREKEIIQWVRDNMKLSKAEISRQAGLSTGIISKEDTRGKALNDKNLHKIIDSLHIKITESGFEFSEGSFNKIKISQNILGAPDYSGLFAVLDKFKGKKIKIYIVTSIPRSLLDKIDRAFQEGVLSEVPGTYLVINVENGSHLLFARRGGSRAYLTYLMRLTKKLEALGCEVINIRDRNIKLNQADRNVITGLITRHARENVDDRN